MAGNLAEQSITKAERQIVWLAAWHPRFSLGRSLLTTFQIQQELLPPESTPVSSKLAILVYHPMAGNHDSEAILAVRSADCTLSDQSKTPG